MSLSAKEIVRLIIVVFALNLVSAALFVRLVNRPVYDDPYNISDVHTYATQGVSVVTIRSNRNPPGPTSFIWMAAAIRLLHGEELRDARIGAMASWVLLVLGVLIGARHTCFPQAWYGALLTLLIFPHSVEATALVLTEGPALLFATLGALAWIEFASRPQPSRAVQILGIAGALSMGIAVTCRQYYLMLLPSAALLAFQRLRGQANAKKAKTVSMLLSLIVAAMPVVLLIAIWKGFSSPSMAAGTSYPMWKARMGLSFSRPVIAAFYAAIYLFPISFPIMFLVKLPRRRLALFTALLGGVAAGYGSSFLLQPGPLRTLVRALSRAATAQSIIFGLIAAVTIYNAVAAGLLLWDKRMAFLSCPPIVFALLTVVFFTAEQFGVGGNIPLYDRYLLQLTPFLGIIAFSLVPRLTYARVTVLTALSVVSHVMLWRYAISGINF